MPANKTNKRLTVTARDRERLQKMIGARRRSFRTLGDPYESYLGALERRLARTTTIGESDVDGDIVTMNSTVCVRALDTGTRQVLTLVYEANTDFFGESVSVVAPLGRAMLGARVGDIVEWQARRGTRRLQIERIIFQPEAAGAFDL